jgi:hypothetical protein
MRAQQLYGSRMPGATAQEQRILANTANAQAAAERNSGSGADNLAMAAILNAQGNEASAALAEREAQNKLVTNQILTGAENTMTNENDKMFQDKLRKYTEAVTAKNALMNASYMNRNSAAQTLAQGGLMLLGSGLGQNKPNKSGGLLSTTPRQMATLGTRGSLTAGMSPVVGNMRTLPGRSYVPQYVGDWKAKPGG